MRRAPGAPPVRHAALALVLLAALGLGGCGGDRKSASQVAAKVNKGEVSVHQINFVLQRTPGISQERLPEAKKAILERLIEQELLVQAADDKALDRDPQVLQMLEAARREVLSRAYLARVAAGVPKPDAREIADFFERQPQLFANRKIYKFDEIVLQGRPANWAEIEKALLPTKSIQEAATVLRERGMDAPVATNVTRATEQIPLALVPAFDRHREGDVVIYQQPPNIVIAQIVSMRPEPVDEKRAGPVIEQFLLNTRRAEAVQAEVKRLRETAKITYVGEFEAGAPKPAPQAPAPRSAETVMDKGLKGLK